jgi:arginase
MVLRTLLGAGPAALVDLLPRRLAPTQIVLAGTRDLDRDEALFISDTAVSMLTPADLLVPDRVIGRIRAAGFTKVYVHLDLDVMDPAEFRDTLVSAPGGISVENAANTIHGIADTFDVVGFSVMEFQPRAADAAVRLQHLLDRCGIAIGALDRSRT